MPLPEMSPERRAEIAKLCGLERGAYGNDRVFYVAGSIRFLTRDWLRAPSESGDEALYESLMLRGLVRAGVLGHANAPHFFAAIGGEKGLWKDGPQTPIEAMVALANAHLDALDAKEKTE